MTYWKCPNCAGERETKTKENIIMALCPCCQLEMEEWPYPNLWEVEVKDSGS